MKKQIIKAIWFLPIIFLASCGPRLTSNLINPQPRISIDEKVAFLDTHHKLPDHVTKVGDLRFQDSVFSTDCSFSSILNRARKIAREHGANIVKIIDKQAPDLWSSCYRLKIKLYQYEGDVSALRQYRLTLD